MVLHKLDQTGADAKDTITKMKKHKSNMWQHNELPLVSAVRSDNIVVKSLSNYHSPIIIPNDLQRLIRIDNVRQRNSVGVPVPLQQKEYSETFHKINKGIGAEAKYDMGGNRYVYD